MSGLFVQELEQDREYDLGLTLMAGQKGPEEEGYLLPRFKKWGWP